MKVAIILGSVRNNREGIKAAKFALLQCQLMNWHPEIIDPAALEVPLLDKTYQQLTDPQESLKKIHSVLKEADGFLFVTAEYNHSIPPALKNLIDYFKEEYYYKPSAIISYSTGPFGGVRATEHLRNICAELRMPTIPASLPISTIHESLNENGTSVDGVYEKRGKRFFNEFAWFMEALKNQREKGIPV
ncbi:MAG TPA: NAD(P)H-dependent oxidoreductase [Ignavibacteriaceae bacterium]|jgi:NAD(P)H-dependent FMN reductase|nr:NAD(P)H-dependent oxidoreductase [Ignavibacteriaceae bacterium]